MTARHRGGGERACGLGRKGEPVSRTRVVSKTPADATGAGLEWKRGCVESTRRGPRSAGRRANEGRVTGAGGMGMDGRLFE